jgi:hypothetical protein
MQRCKDTKLLSVLAYGTPFGYLLCPSDTLRERRRYALAEPALCAYAVAVSSGNTPTALSHRCASKASWRFDQKLIDEQDLKDENSSHWWH